MKTNRSIELSKNFYRQLLRLYPQTYRTTYENEMLHVFADQCRDVYQQRSEAGLLLLWLRTFVDVGKTVVVEHLSNSNAGVGLLEAIPNAPLPWKGVFLVLIPGLIFFISQIAQLTTDRDWFFIVYYWAALLLIVPVLLVWIIARRFPIWGLIPFGLLYANLLNYRSTYPALIGKWFSIGQPKSLIMVFRLVINPYYVMPLLVIIILLVFLALYITRKRGFTKPAVRWLFLYIVLIVCQLLGETYRTVSSYVTLFHLNAESFGKSLYQISLEYLYVPLAFLLLVLIGKLFARRHGGLSFLLLLGYLLPTVIFGRYGSFTDMIPFFVVVLAVLSYRFMVALVAPIWLAREATLLGRQRAAIVPVVVAVLCQMILTIIVSIATMQYNYYMTWLDFLLAIWGQVIILAGLGLAVALYLPSEKSVVVVSPSTPIPTIE